MIATTPSFVNTIPVRGGLGCAPPAGRHLLREREYEFCKRGLDVVGSVLLLIGLSPLLLLIAVLVQATGPGPVLFKQKRLGRGGGEFWCYKYRTMVPDAETRLADSTELHARFAANYKIKDDPRVTRLGAFLRRTSLDEFPQFWNVLRGEMSLVGPRPIVPPELSKYGEFAGRLLQVKPGLGGLWQVSGRSDTSYATRVALDVAYVDGRSFWLDLRLLVRTALVVLRGGGAY